MAGMRSSIEAGAFEAFKLEFAAKRAQLTQAAEVSAEQSD